MELKGSENLDEVMREYTPMVYRIAYARLGVREDAEDVSQNVFLRYFKANRSFESEEHRKAFLIRTAVNCANSYAKSAWMRHRKFTEELTYEGSLLTDDLANEQIERSESRREIMNEVEKLPHKYRTVIYLFYFEDMSTEQIAKVLKTKDGTVRSQLTRAREMLKEKLKGVEI